MENKIKMKGATCLGCERPALFMYKGESRPILCRKHKIDGMISSRKQRICMSCDRRSSFNVPGEKVPKFCAKHKMASMVHVSHHCLFANCSEYARYGQPKSKPMYCSKHRKLDMKNTKDRICEFVKCSVQASCGYRDTKVRRFCARHRLDGMISFKSRVCSECSIQCSIRARYGLPGGIPEHCANHKKSGEISRPLRKCEVCVKPAIYGINAIPEYCEEHKSDLHINLVQKTCGVCSVLEIVDQEGKCANCSTYLNARLYLRKQRLVKTWLDGDVWLKAYESYDHIIDSGVCGKERPDFMWDAGTHKVILEVDEYQHGDRDGVCEVNRMKNLTNSNGMPTYWIRYNPDGEFQRVREQTRKNMLLAMLKEALSSVPKNGTEFCRVVYMFYDGKERSPMKVLDITPKPLLLDHPPAVVVVPVPPIHR